jgi:hypothetical protein
MKNSTRHISKRLRKVKRGREAVSREVSRAVRKLKQDATFRKLVAEVGKHLAELAIRVFVFSLLNQCVRSGASERAQLIPIRRKPTVVS